ncbi:MAG: aminotransferase [Patescibacteria group bacterium]|nr:MAG: aminotransferase [Patescibacteria group bacterium]
MSADWSLSKRSKTSSDYVFMRLQRLKLELEQKQQVKVLDLSAGVPKFPPSKLIKLRLQELVGETDVYYYPSYKPLPEFSSAILDWYRKRFGVKTELSVQIGHGAKDILTHLPYLFTDEGDEVLVPDPGYPGFVSAFRYLGIKAVYYQLPEENNFSLDIDRIKQVVSKKTKAIIVNFPSNPTGQTADKFQLQKIVDFCREAKIVLIYDNAYSEIYFSKFVPPSIFECQGAQEVALEVGSVSKTFSLAGIRVGFVIGSEEFISAFSTMKSAFDTGVFTALQRLTAYAYSNFDYQWYEQMILKYKENIIKTANILNSLGLEFEFPKAGLYFWAKIPDRFKSSEEFVFDVLNKKYILLAPGSAFGSSGSRYIRASFCALP